MCDGPRYTSEQRAINAIAHSKQKAHVPYLCERCFGWHAAERVPVVEPAEPVPLHDLDRGEGECFRKRVFTTERRAQRAAARTGLRVYGCPHCGGWHLTSQI